jgi:hypothetical protein
MANAPSTAPLDGLPTRRIEIDATHSYELTLFRPSGVLLHIEERGHDAAIQLTPLRIVELRAELATALVALGHGMPTVGVATVRSPAALAIVEHLRHAFEALVELDKHAPAEVDAIAALTIGHVRSWRPFVLQELANG